MQCAIVIGRLNDDDGADIDIEEARNESEGREIKEDELVRRFYERKSSHWQNCLGLILDASPNFTSLLRE